MKANKNKLIPDLRFPEFKDNWANISIAEVCDVFRGGTFSKVDMVENGKFYCIHYGQLFTKYDDIIETVISKTNKSAVFKSKVGDILMPSSDVTPNGLAKASVILLDDVVLGGDMNILRPKIDINSIFLNYLINYNKTEIIKLVSGTTVKHIYPSQIVDLKLIISNSEKEQQKIASCLSSLDKIITAQTEKLELLQNHKKGLMQNLFPQDGEKVPKFRFPEFLEDGYWKRKILEELFKIGNGRDYKHLNKGKIPVYGSGGYMISVDEYLYDGESVCIGRKGTIDKPMFLIGKFWTVDTLFYTHSFINCLPKFIHFIFQNINWRKHNEAGGVPSLSKSNIYKIEIYLPEVQEQQKIVSCLSSLDNLIAAQTEKIEQLKSHKKGLMQGLFPKII